MEVLRVPCLNWTVKRVTCKINKDDSHPPTPVPESDWRVVTLLENFCLLLLLFNYKKHAACFSSSCSHSLLLSSKLAAGRNKAETRAASPITAAVSFTTSACPRELEAHLSEMTVRNSDVFRCTKSELASLSGSQHLQEHRATQLLITMGECTYWYVQWEWSSLQCVQPDF